MTEILFTVNCCFLTWIHISQEAAHGVWYSHFFQNFPQFIVIHTVRDFGIVNKEEIDNQLEPLEGHGSRIAEACLGEFWALLACEMNAMCGSLSILWHCLSLRLEWKLTFSSPVAIHCWILQICWHIECSTFTGSSFRIWNSSTGIPSPPLALFVVMLSKACRGPALADPGSSKGRWRWQLHWL